MLKCFNFVENSFIAHFKNLFFQTFFLYEKNNIPNDSFPLVGLCRSVLNSTDMPDYRVNFVQDANASDELQTMEREAFEVKVVGLDCT